MDIFDLLSLIGGLCLFLFGMSLMGQALERRAGGRLNTLLGRMTSGKLAGLLTGLGITAIIQSSSATTVMVVGFVNSGLMSLKQAINVILGANIGTTVTAWILSLAGIDSSNSLVRLLKPSSFVPVLSLIGIILYLFRRNEKQKDTGMILLGFAVLMFGMETMSAAVSGLKAVPGFTRLFTLFRDPISGVLAGAAVTAVIQSSSASVGILQALSSTGAIRYSAAIPIIMGQNIGTCITALLSSIGANRNAKRAALVHLSFNVIGTIVCLIAFIAVRGRLSGLMERAADPFGIAVAHSVFNVACTVLLLPLSHCLEVLVIRLVPDVKQPEKTPELDERLLMTPPIALDRCHEVAADMLNRATTGVRQALALCDGGYTEAAARSITDCEEACDHYEDIIGTYLVRLSTLPLSAEDSRDAARLLRMIGDAERISDHAVDILRCAQELQHKSLRFSDEAIGELASLREAVLELLDTTAAAFSDTDITMAARIEPLRQLIEQRKEQLRRSHVLRLQKSSCSIELGFIWGDLMTAIERIAAHCANISDQVCETDDPHEAGRTQRQNSADYRRLGKRCINEVVPARVNFSSAAIADFAGLLEVSQGICKKQMAEKAPCRLPPNYAAFP